MVHDLSYTAVVSVLVANQGGVQFLADSQGLNASDQGAQRLKSTTNVEKFDCGKKHCKQVELFVVIGALGRDSPFGRPHRSFE